MNVSMNKLVAAVATFAFAAFAVHADEGKMTVDNEGTVTVEAGGVKMESGADGTSLEYGGVKVSDGEDGKSLEAGGVKIAEDNDGNSSVEVGDGIGGRESVSVGAGGDNWNANAEAGATAEAGWSVGADDQGNVGMNAGAKVGVDGSVSVGVNGQLGDDENNVHGSGEVKLSAEVMAEIAARLERKADGTVVAKAEAKAGASVSAEGVIKGGVTVWGVPIDVVLSGGVSAGAEASAAAGVEFDAKTGKFKVTLEASAVVGVGAKGHVSVEIGIVQLAQAIGTGVGNAVNKIGEGIDKVGDAVGDLWDWIDKKWNGGDAKGGEDSDPFDSEPEGAGGDSGSARKYQGLKSLNLVK